MNYSIYNQRSIAPITQLSNLYQEVELVNQTDVLVDMFVVMVTVEGTTGDCVDVEPNDVGRFFVPFLRCESPEAGMVQIIGFKNHEGRAVPCFGTEVRYLDFVMRWQLNLER
ncbi:MAG: hypothetical protein KDK76_04495 [Chlamydiia bacterium]|nr:hypothetical protein [Chlamydiia bacterium]